MRHSVVLTPYPDLGKVGGCVPAFDRWTEGHSVEEALDMAREPIGSRIDLAREDGAEPPVETGDAPLLTVVSVPEAPVETAA